MTIFSLKNKKVFILGGSGLIGKPTNDLLIKHGAKLFNLDLIDSNQKKVKFIKFDLKNAEGIKLNLTKIIKKYGCPSIFINCSYPTSENWSKANFSHVNQNIINENLKIHLSTYVFTSNLIAEEMRKRKIKGSIIQFSSIYGMVAQNLHVYKNTKMKENYVDSVPLFTGFSWHGRFPRRNRRRSDGEKCASRGPKVCISYYGLTIFRK